MWYAHICTFCDHPICFDVASICQSCCPREPFLIFDGVTMLLCVTQSSFGTWVYLKMTENGPPKWIWRIWGYTIFRQTYMSPGGCTILKLGTDICSFHIRGTCTMAIFAATMKSMELGVAKLTCGDAANTLCQCNQVNTSFPHLRGTVYTAMRWGWLTMNLFSLFI